MDSLKTFFYEHKGWRYEVKLDLARKLVALIIEDENKTGAPDILYKHYSLSEHSIDSLINTYLFAAHPRHFNDPYDCNMHIFDLTNTPLEAYTTFLKVLEETSSDISIKDLFYSDKPQLDTLYLNAFWHIMYSKVGIVSLTDNPLNIQMWSYYSNLKGFQIGLNPTLLPDEFKGPFKVRYVEDFDKIPIRNELFIPMIYQVSHKEINWRHESEWRYLVVGPNEMEVPFAIFRRLQSSPHNRKFSFDKNAVKEITLGCYFFTPDEKVEEYQHSYVFDLSGLEVREREKKLNILDYIIDNRQIDLYFLAWERISNFKLFKIPAVIEKKDNYVFKMRLKFDG